MRLHLHMTAIIPFVVALALLVIGLHFAVLPIQFLAGAILIYACVAHTNNVLIIRRETRQTMRRVIPNMGEAEPYQSFYDR